MYCQRVLLGVFHPCLWPLKAPGSTFWGRVAKPVISSLTPVHPTSLLLFSLGSSLPKCLDQCTDNEQETQLKWFPLELGTGAGIKNTRIMGLEGWERSLMISSAVWIQCTYGTDRHQTTAKLRLWVVSCDKKEKSIRGSLIRTWCSIYDHPVFYCCVFFHKVMCSLEFGAF